MRWVAKIDHHDNRSVGNLYTTRLDRKLGTRDILNRHTHPRFIIALHLLIHLREYPNGNLD